MSKTLWFFKIAEGGGEALALVKGMLINAQDHGALKADTLGGLAPGELGVDAPNGGSANGSHPGHGGGGDALVMVKVNSLTEGLCAVATSKQPGKLRDEGAPAVLAGKTPGMDDQFGGLAQTVEMTGPAPVAALAAEATASAARAALSPLSAGDDMQSKLILVLDSQHPIAVNTNSVKHTGHGGGLPRPMSPFFDQEPHFIGFNGLPLMFVWRNAAGWVWGQYWRCSQFSSCNNSRKMDGVTRGDMRARGSPAAAEDKD
jgi:hypothetical protein